MRLTIPCLAVPLIVASYLVTLGAASALPGENGKNSGGDHSGKSGSHGGHWGRRITPKVFLISMFDPEDVWTARIPLDKNITVPGLSRQFPDVHCNKDGTICQLVTAMGEINAAVTVTSLLLSDQFDLTKTYFLIGGISGVNPQRATLASVGLARYAVQVAMAHEIDAREMPANWTTGYWLIGTDGPGERAGADIYGTEVYELNTNLRAAVRPYIDGIKLNDSDAAIAYRAKFNYAPANQPPSVVYGDVSTSDLYFTGSLLCDAFANITKLWTNGTGEYVFTAQEDNATFEAMIRMHKAGRMDFSRVLLMRTGSNFDRPPPGMTAFEGISADQGGFGPALENIYVAGRPIVDGIIREWDAKYAKGITPPGDWLFYSDNLSA